MGRIGVSNKNNKLLYFPGGKEDEKKLDSLSVKKEGRQKMRTRKFAVLALVGVLSIYGLMVMTSLVQQWWQMKGVNAEVAQLNQEIEKMKEGNELLREEIKRLHSKSYVERVAREKLGLVRPGEKVLLPAQEGEVMPLGDNSGPLYE